MNQVVQIKSVFNNIAWPQLKYFILASMILLLFAPLIFNLVKLWIDNADYSHGFLVVPIAFFMIWKKRKYLSSLNFEPSWFGLPILIIAIICYLVAFIAKFHTLTHLSMIVSFIGLLVFTTGWQMTKALFLPVLFLAFMFPVPNAYYIMITNPLKIVVTKLSASIIQFSGTAVYREGNLLYFSTTQLEVTEACSGLRSMYSYLMLGAVFALFCKTLSRKIIIILSAIPLAILVNIIRVTGTGILADYYGEKVAQGFFHEFSGLLVFGLGFFILLSLNRLMDLKQRTKGLDK